MSFFRPRPTAHPSRQSPECTAFPGNCRNPFRSPLCSRSSQQLPQPLPQAPAGHAQSVPMPPIRLGSRNPSPGNEGDHQHHGRGTGAVTILSAH